LLIEGEHTRAVEAVLRKDPEWVAPLPWRSEFRSVVTLYVHRGFMTLRQTLQLTEDAELLMQGEEAEVISMQVLSLAASSTCSACDCEFVALAQQLSLPLITSDSGILEAFPSIAISPGTFVSPLDGLRSP
jgi:predicted nucleic acid-binding protein